MKEALFVVFLYRSVRYSLLGFYLEPYDHHKNFPILVVIVRVYQMSIVCGIHPFLYSNLIHVLYFFCIVIFSRFCPIFLNFISHIFLILRHRINLTFLCKFAQGITSFGNQNKVVIIRLSIF